MRFRNVGFFVLFTTHTTSSICTEKLVPSLLLSLYILSVLEGLSRDSRITRGYTSVIRVLYKAYTTLFQYIDVEYLTIISMIHQIAINYRIQKQQGETIHDLIGRHSERKTD